MADLEVEFDRLYREHFARLVVLGVSMCGDRDVARSLAQDAMVRAYEHRDLVLGHPAPVAWLQRVMRNLCVDHLRRSGAEQRAVMRLAGRADGSGSNALGDPVTRWFELIRSLTPAQRAVATLFYAEDLGVEAIASRLEISEGTVKSTLSKVRKRIRRDLKNGVPS